MLYQFLADVGLKRVRYPEVTSINSTTPVEKNYEAAQTVLSKTATRAIYAYQPGKSYRGKRVFKVLFHVFFRSNNYH